jgi:hypothetical protein
MGKHLWMEELREIADQEDDEKLFRAIVSRMIASYGSNIAFQRLISYSALEGHEFSQILHARALPFHAFLCDYIAKRQEKGALRHLSPGLIAFALVSMPAHYGLLTKMYGFDLAKSSDEEAVSAFVQILLNGIRI